MSAFSYRIRRNLRGNLVSPPQIFRGENWSWRRVEGLIEGHVVVALKERVLGLNPTRSPPLPCISAASARRPMVTQDPEHLNCKCQCVFPNENHSNRRHLGWTERMKGAWGGDHDDSFLLTHGQLWAIELDVWVQYRKQREREGGTLMFTHPVEVQPHIFVWPFLRSYSSDLCFRRFYTGSQRRNFISLYPFHSNI